MKYPYRMTKVVNTHLFSLKFM